MPQKDYAAYCKTPQGRAARARQRAKQNEKRRQERKPRNWTTAPLLQVISHWRAS